MALVLALAVQGVADALTLSKTSGDFQAKPIGSTFDITFAVKLESNTTKRTNSEGQQVDEYDQTIDGSGYLVTYIGNKAYRWIGDSSFNDANTLKGGRTYDVSRLPDNPTLKVKVAGDRSNLSSFGTRLPTDPEDTTPSDDLYVDSSKNVVDSRGRPVYIEEGRDTDNNNSNDEWKYARAKADPVAPYTSTASQRYAYNDERIGITSSANVTKVEMIHQTRRYSLAGAEAAGSGYFLSERDKARGIPSSITLRISTGGPPTVTTGATHTVTIADNRDGTRVNDYPRLKPVVDSLVFTLYTVQDKGAADRVNLTGSSFISTGLSKRKIDGDYTVTTTNTLILYEVIEGPGTLYVGTLENPTGTPAKTLIKSAATDIFLYLNRGESRVRAYPDAGRPGDGVTITYDYTGSDRLTGGGRTPTPTPTPTTPRQQTPSLSISVADGETATTRRVTVTATDAQGTTVSGLAITLRSLTSGFTLSDAERSAVSGTAKTITVPTTPGTYTIQASADNYTTASDTITVARIAPGTLTLTPVGTRSGTQQQIRVTASGRTIPSAGLVVTLHGAAFTQTVTIPSGSTSASKIITLPSATGAHSVYASATGYNNSATLTIPAPGSTTTPTPTPTPTPTAPEPSSIQVSGPATRSGTANTQLSAPLLTRVLDEDGAGVAEARVIFRVRTGQGRLTQRGNGRAIAVQTDTTGYARADYTPMSARSTVEAEATGVRQPVTFTITADGSATPAPTPGTGDTTATKPIDPKVLVGAANRPAMVWIDSGMLYGLTGAKPTKIADSVNGAAVGGGTVYWTAKTGGSAGTINSANLDGSGVKTLKTIQAVPMGIAVDTANSKLYWTNSRGRVQNANLDGSSIKNVQQNLSDPTGIALGGGHIYWMEDGDSIRRVNMTGTKVVKDVAVGLMNVGSIAVSGGKVYWTEKTAASAGTITGANLDGTQFKTLATIKAAPIGIAVDTAGKKLYWTNSRGRVQNANLNGSKIQNVVDGLGTPSHIAIGGASQAAAAKPATKPTETQQPKKDTAKYDVNGDGSVDNVDASLVSNAMGTATAKYDVNGDGTVNFLDLLLVFDNRDDDAAGAPTVLGMQLSSVQIAVIEEQIDLLIATGDRSPSAMRTLVYLQQLLATARPEKTQLLANYPNPFNPETWIPYELATDTDVRITIYNAQGVVIRTLQLGQQAAGYYTDRERAAYWDGRNALGEQVASGLYFYQLETDAMSALRKMVILK